MCEEEEKDYLMYISEITAYWAASVAAIIYIWETVIKSIKSKRKKKIKDPELGLLEEEDDEKYSSNNSSPSDSPLSLSDGLRSRIYSSSSNR